MVKKSLIAIALVGMLASTSFAGDEAKGYWKMDDGWPFDYEIDVWYEELELCQIPIYIDIGMYIELVDCNKVDQYGNPIKKIILEQIQCADLLQPSITGTDFPCYSGCEDLTVLSNFNAKLGLKLYKRVVGTDSFITQRTVGMATVDNWSAYFDDAGSPVDTWPVAPGETDFTVCVEASDVNVYLGDPDLPATHSSNVNRVGEVAITVVPDGTPDLCGIMCECVGCYWDWGTFSCTGGTCVPKP
jgi:hypothetical protein